MAAGVAVEGTLEAVDAILLPRGALVQGPLRGFFVNMTTDQLSALEVRAPEVRVRLHEYRNLYARDSDLAGGLHARQLIPTGKSDETYYNVTMTLLPNVNGGYFGGWLGAYPDSSTVFAMTGSGPTEVVPLQRRDVGHAVERENADPDLMFYAPEVGQHLRVSAPGSIEMTGGGVLKLAGPRVRVQHDGGEFVLTTGECCSGQTGVGVFAWAHVDLGSEANVLLQGEREVHALTPAAEAWWAGPAAVMPVGGELRGPSHVVRLPEMQLTELVGEFHAYIAPQDLPDGRVGSVARVHGEVVDGAPFTYRLPVYERLASTPPVAIGTIALAAGAAGAGMGVFAYRRSVQRTGLLVDLFRGAFPAPGAAEYEAAALLASLGRDAAACRLLERALRLAPEYYRRALEDRQFEELREMKAFQAIVDRAAERTFEPPP